MSSTNRIVLIFLLFTLLVTSNCEESDDSIGNFDAFDFSGLGGLGGFGGGGGYAAVNRFDFFIAENLPPGMRIGILTKINATSEVIWDFDQFEYPEFSISGDTLFSESSFDFESQPYYQFYMQASVDTFVSDWLVRIQVVDVVDEGFEFLGEIDDHFYYLSEDSSYWLEANIRTNFGKFLFSYDNVKSRK